MAEWTKDGGPAYPVPGLQHDEDFNGMSLRDYFAAAALTGLCTNRQDMTSVFAGEAYAIADAMLKARKQENGK